MNGPQAFRWGIIGPGRIAHKFAAAQQTVPDGELAAVASRDTVRAEAYSVQYQAGRIHETYTDLVDDADVDAIYIATPHRFHHDQARLCLKAGKPVLCEKPLTVNAEEAIDLIELARAKNTFPMEGMWTRFLPIYRVVRGWLDDGIIGEIKLISSTFSFRAERDLADRWLRHELAGGALLDLGVYNVSMSHWIAQDKPSSIAASAQIGETAVDEQTAATLIYPSGTRSQFTCGFLAKMSNDLVIYGSEGAVHIAPDFWQGTWAVLSIEGESKLKPVPFRKTDSNI